MKALQTFAAALTLTGTTAIVCAGGLQVSATDPLRLSFHEDGDLLYVMPGNQGDAWFKNDSGESLVSPGNLQPWQDVYCDSQWLDLESPDYDLHMTDKATTGAEEYWLRLQKFVYSCTFRGDVPLWKITDDFVKAWAAQPGILDDMTSQVRTFASQDMFDPTFVFDVNNWNADTELLRRELTAAFPGWPVGVYVSADNADKTPARGWPFVICGEEVIPETFRGQAAVSWLRSKYGQVPVIISPARPDFQRDIVWLGCGASGIWFRPLAEPGTVANRHGAIHMRATTTYLNRFGNNRVRLNVRSDHAALNFSLGADDFGWAGVISGGTDVLEIPVPGTLEGQLVVGNWFNPATDENIIEPQKRLSRHTFTAQPPSDSLWAYSLSRTTVASDTKSTVSAIRELY